jgi:hypothetical protein
LTMWGPQAAATSLRVIIFFLLMGSYNMHNIWALTQNQFRIDELVFIWNVFKSLKLQKWPGN